MASEQAPSDPPPPPPPPQAPPSPRQAPVPEPAVVKLTRGHSCVLCQQRKVRCDKQKPCANCVKAQVECRVVPPQPPRRRKKKPQERDLIDRLRKYESLLTQAGVDFDPIGHQLKLPLDPGDDVADLEHDLIGLKTSPSSSTDHVSPAGGRARQHHVSNVHQYRGDDDDSSDEEYEGPTIHNAYDTMFGNSDGFPFVVGGAMASVTNAHPSAIQMFQLWQVYISNVDPLLKITHTPTLQADIISAGANPSKIPQPLEALMFAIYFIAITSLNEKEVHTMFGEDRAILLGKYHNATQQALVNASFMRSNELAVLQAYFLYLLSVRPYTDPRSMFGLLGLAFRIATRMGLHRDSADTNMSPFEAEQRRRLWWQIACFDKRIAEITGSTVNILSSCTLTTRLPLNINDADLNTQAKVQPASYTGPTEMIFALTRIELTVAASPDNVRQSVSTPGGGPLQKPMVHYSGPSPGSTDVVSHVANQYLPNDLAAFCAYIENVYLKPCDTKVPLQYFTLLMTRQALCKLRIIDFLCRTANSDSVSQPERDSYFMEALRMIEYDNIIQSAESLQGFRWYTYAHFPLPAYLCLVSELRYRTTGELCERAWDVMVENHDRRGLVRRHNRNPLHIAFGRYFVKAWDAREVAELQNGRTLTTPKIIQLLRATLGMTARPAVPPPQPPQQQQQHTSQYHPRHPPASASMNTPVAHAQHGMSPHGSLSSAPPHPGGTMSAGVNDMDMASMGMTPSSIYSSSSGGQPMGVQSASGTPPQLHHQHSQPHLGGGGGGGGGMGAPPSHIMMDDPAAAMMYTPGYDNMATPTQGMFGSTVSAGMQDSGMPAMDWDYLVQVTSLGGFNAHGFYTQGTTGG
ncbi:hypothetical protein VTJ49DRAFT_763 [Mycothermus thermophilus]|uniref:Zn(2)-C6 fungal-type domain-containing protein n=1 Tax=Humicola insolens TaxID=85995 RepID=A0ABR3VEA9_HUMIN